MSGLVLRCFSGLVLLCVITYLFAMREWLGSAVPGWLGSRLASKSMCNQCVLQLVRVQRGSSFARAACGVDSAGIPACGATQFCLTLLHSACQQARAGAKASCQTKPLKHAALSAALV